MTDPQEPQDGATLLFNTVYCSRARAGVGEADVDRIIEVARRHNPANGITGLLVFGSGIFFQWLEGPRPQVTQLMDRLHADPRHEQLVLLGEGEETRERLFPGWDMEHVDADEIRDVLVDARTQAADPLHVAALDRLLEHLDSGALSALGAR